MSEAYGDAPAVIAGLVSGCALIVAMFLVQTPTFLFPASVETNGQWDENEQRKVIEILLEDTEIRQLFAGEELRVWSFGANNSGGYDCRPNDCSIIGLEKTGSSAKEGHASLLALVNTENRAIERLDYSGDWRK